MKASKAQLLAGLFVGSLLFGLLVRPLFAGVLSSGYICTQYAGDACPSSTSGMAACGVDEDGNALDCMGFPIIGARCKRTTGGWSSGNCIFLNPSFYTQPCPGYCMGLTLSSCANGTIPQGCNNASYWW